ncbi:PTS sugar transporter subunit IIA [Gulosibacter sp. ACHW.36C]|uniref:Ascorbate-specific PTS system EIIA component n=1 Tax=Gulosibacter sediminis TaxID=1729695 RepID=A0ABY4MX80_9MICO|nr:PTS sugar transporter subunit IIA [Gulosibacter sediminis]UQN15030.1 PTS sugar transporter subunit IIA [Gulosibacter sediminis]
MSKLSSLISTDAVQLYVPAEDWRSAVIAAGDLLVQTGATEPEYTDSMLATIDEHGPYIVIAPGFALAHARPNASVKRTGLSFVRLANPVEFGAGDNDPVTIVMGMAAADSTEHQQALATLAGVLGDPVRRAALDTANTPEAVLEVLTSDPAQASAAEPSTPRHAASVADDREVDLTGTVASKGHILTVCGNGVGTSIFLKNTLEQVLGKWGWAPYFTVEATDTISAKGKSKEADLVLTSGAIAESLGDLGVPVEIIGDFTSQQEIDGALRRRYAV